MSSQWPPHNSGFTTPRHAVTVGQARQQVILREQISVTSGPPKIKRSSPSSSLSQVARREGGVALSQEHVRSAGCARSRIATRWKPIQSMPYTAANGPTEDGHAVTLRCVCFSRLPGLDTPKMNASFSVLHSLRHQEYWNPQSTNNVIVGWKGDVIIVKHGCHCSSCRI